MLGGYILLYPASAGAAARVHLFFFTLIEVPAVFLLGFWFAEQLCLGLAGLTSPVSGGEGVAYFAHVGGFIFGLLVIRLFVRRGKAERPLPVY